MEENSPKSSASNSGCWVAAVIAVALIWYGRSQGGNSLPTPVPTLVTTVAAATQTRDSRAHWVEIAMRAGIPAEDAPDVVAEFQASFDERQDPCEGTDGTWEDCLRRIWYFQSGQFERDFYDDRDQDPRVLEERQREVELELAIQREEAAEGTGDGDHDVGYTCAECIKGNVSFTSGERIYHLPGCKDYGATGISTQRGERWFSTEAEAVAAGWRKSKNCP